MIKRSIVDCTSQKQKEVDVCLFTKYVSFKIQLLALYIYIYEH